jgi:hypothetical protein
LVTRSSLLLPAIKVLFDVSNDLDELHSLDEERGPGWST